MQLLSGRELVGYIKERQAKQVRALKQAQGITPKLAIIATVDNPVIELYMKLKQNYGSDILIDVDIHRVKQVESLKLIGKLNDDDNVHGIIVQLPLENSRQQTEILNAVDKAKDVDGLSDDSLFDPATPLAINWLLAGYNINLEGKEILIVGEGALVGSPLTKMWQSSGYTVVTANRQTANLADLLHSADVVVTATGSPGLIKAQDLKNGAVVVDAGAAVAEGKTVGDLDPAVYELENISVTPQKGGVGPLTVCALFDNVIRSSSK